MSKVDLDDFAREIECVFEGERYSVRDNGAVFRHQPAGKRARPTDNQWTFGKENSANPYLHISSVRIHRIVATAFHGPPPDSKYVVDHIDSNCRNNRPENLRWLTRLENALNNPATRKKIEYLCGSVEEFLKNPSMLNSLQRDPNFAWMRAVTPEEAQNCLTRMSIWANTKSTPSKSGHKLISSGNFTERIYSPLKKWEVFGREPGLDLSLTPWCAQYMWGNDRYFPSCPKAFGDSPLDEYFQSLNTGAVLSCGEDATESTQLKVVQAVILRDKAAILVLCEGKDQGFSIVAVELDAKSRHFIHMLLGSFSTKTDAETSFSRMQELTDFWSAAYSNAYKR